MSTAATTAPIPTTLPERAFSLFCQGMRSPEIARQLGVPERTVRAWIASIRQDIAASERDRLAEEFFRAVEHLHQLSAAAWAAFARDQNLPEPSLASHPMPQDPSSSPTSNPTAAQSPAPSTAPRPRTASHGPRYLRLALDAQRQINNLLSLYGAGASNALTSTTPTAPTAPTAPPLAPAPSPGPLSKNASATPARKIEIPAETTSSPTPPTSPCPSVSSVSSVVNPVPPTDSATDSARKTEIPAESATNTALPLRASSCPPCSSWLNPRPFSVSSVSSVVESRPPAEPPTTTARKIAIPAKTAMSHPSSVPLRVLRDLRGKILVPPPAPNRRRTGRKSRRARK